MYKGKKILSIIPARKGSKRIPGKNIKPLAGKPLIFYSIDTSLKSSIIDLTAITTDIDSIEDMADGAFFIKRPDELAQDKSPALGVMKHAVIEAEKEFKDKFDIIILLQPTSPLRTLKTIEKSLKKLIDLNGDSAISVKKQKLLPVWTFVLDGDYMKFMFKNDLSSSQDPIDTYEINGSVFAYKREILMEAEKFAIGEKIVPIIMNEKESLDIDHPEDFEIVEAVMRYEDNKDNPKT